MIYCVEDDDNIRELVVYTLDSTGLPAKGFPGGVEFHTALKNELPELVLLDIMLPGEDGMELLSDLRKDPRTRSIPVIMLTAKGAEYDKVSALDMGADDYVTKPFGMMELVSRIRAVLRRIGKGKNSDEPVLSSGSIKIDVLRHKVTVGGKEVVLTLKEFELLKMLILNSGVVLTREQLLEDIWGYNFDGETRTVDVHVRSLRQKLKNEGDRIETVRGLGYRIREK